MPPYFLTGDNPSHLYNASVVSDLLRNGQSSFYGNFMDINSSIGANWFSHILLGCLLYFFSPPIAEKILITLYIIVFLTGAYRLIRFNTKEYNILPLGIFLLLFHIILIKGFINFSFSIAYLLWFVWHYLKFIQHPNRLHLLYCFLSSILLYLLHPVTYFIGFLAVVLVSIFYLLEFTSGNYKQLVYPIMLSVLVNLPIILFGLYFNQSHNTTAFELCMNWKALPMQFMLGSVFVCYSELEKWIISTVTFLLLISIAITYVSSFKEKKIKISLLGYQVAIAMMIVMYFIISHQYIEHLEIRLQLITYTFILITISICNFSKLSKQIIHLILGFAFILLSIIRFPLILQHSDAVQEMMEIENRLEAHKTLLSLCFHHKGNLAERNKPINQINGSFIHANNYLGIRKQLLLLDNYEANTTWFPTQFKSEINPYIHLCNNFSIEQEPPLVDVTGYELQTKLKIDYILLSFLNVSDKSNNLFQGIDTTYNLTYKSSKGRFLLYERK